MSWEEFFKQNDKLIKHIENQLEDTLYTPNHDEIFYIFKRVPFEKLKVVIIGDQPYSSSADASGVAFACKNNLNTPLLLERIIKELEKSIVKFKPPLNNQLEKWLDEGIFFM